MTYMRRLTLFSASLVAGVALAAESASPALSAPAQPSASPLPPLPAKPSARWPQIGGADAGYDIVLASVVNEQGLVRYENLAQGVAREALNAAVNIYGQVELPADSPARLAFWINAYNANVLRMAAEESRKEGFTSVKSVPGFFDQATITVAGETMTLNDLANVRIKSLGDPRVHAALVSAAAGSPPLRKDPYSPAKLDAELDDQCKRWINDGSRFQVKDGVLHLSTIIKQHKDEFAGKPFGDHLGFVRHYADAAGPIAAIMANPEPPSVQFIEFDWSLNQAPPATPKPAPAPQP
jgi:hypothetical protein